MNYQKENAAARKYGIARPPAFRAESGEGNEMITQEIIDIITAWAVTTSPPELEPPKMSKVIFRIPSRRIYAENCGQWR